MSETNFVHIIFTNFFNFSSAKVPSFRRFLSFFPVPNQYFLAYFDTEHSFLFLKDSAVLFATVSSESSAYFLIFERSVFKSNEIVFRRFQNFSNFWEPRFSGKPHRTNSFSQSKLRKETANLVLGNFCYICISCNLGDFLPS